MLSKLRRSWVGLFMSLCFGSAFILAPELLQTATSSYTIPSRLKIKTDVEKIVLACPNCERSSHCLPSATRVVHLSAVTSTSNRAELIYKYTSEEGTIQGDGSEAVWDLNGSAPGDYKATLTVEDPQRRGRTVTASTTVHLVECRGCVLPLPNQVPTVNLSASSTTITMPCDLGTSSSTCTPTNDATVSLTVNAVDPNGETVLYTYSTDRGRITGEAPNLKWDLSGAPEGGHWARVEISEAPPFESCHAFSTVTVTVKKCQDCR